MKQILILCLIFYTIPLLGQNLDSSSVIKIQTLWDLYISPQKELIFFDKESMYHQKIEDEFWGKNEFIYLDQKEHQRITLDFITDDIWLAHTTNKLDGTSDEKPILIERTTDRGQSWEVITIGYTKEKYYEGIGEIWKLENGKIWLSGKHHKIYFSENFGADWTTKYLSDSLIYSADEIVMKNDSVGAVITFNEIAITRDNFKTAIKIPTPYDQNLVKSWGLHDLHVINNQLIVKQRNKYFWTTFGDTLWQPFFDNQFSSLKLDRVTNDLFGLDRDGQFIKFENKLKYFNKYTSVGGLELFDFQWEIIDGIIYI